MRVDFTAGQVTGVDDLERLLRDALKATFEARAAAYDEEVASVQLLRSSRPPSDAQPHLCRPSCWRCFLSPQDVSACPPSTCPPGVHSDETPCPGDCTYRLQDYEARCAWLMMRLLGDQVRRLMAMRQAPGWQFATLFLVKDSLAAMLQAAGMDSRRSL